MRRVHPLMRAIGIQLLALISTGLAAAPAATAEDSMPDGSFRSVILRNGGEVILRHASSHRVTLLAGSTEWTGVTIDDSNRLVIDRCRSDCPRGYQLRVEVLAPEIDDVMVEDGGTLRILAGFPARGELRAQVHDGGTIDLRSMIADRVSAKVWSGGRILTWPRKTLVASVAQGGNITFWGNPNVQSSIDQGGVVEPGKRADADKPLLHIAPSTPNLAPVPPVPPTRVRGSI